MCAVDHTSFSFPGSGRKFCSTFKSQRIPIPFEKVLQVSLGIPGIVIEKNSVFQAILELGSNTDLASVVASSDSQGHFVLTVLCLSP